MSAPHGDAAFSPTARPARLNVGVVSAGRVGSVLGAALRRAGHTVTGVSAVSADSLRRAEELLPGAPVLPPDQVAAAADLVLLAVPDDALAGLVTGLVATGSLHPGQIVAHTSGSHGIEVLAPAVDAGVLPLALHPVMTFTGRAEDLQRIDACCFGVTAATGDEAAWNVGEALVVEMSGEPVRIPAERRKLYHAALSHGANYLITVVADSVELLRRAGIDEPERLLGPLLSAALDNALRHGERALTGPVARGDADTVRAHLAVLTADAPDTVEVYRALATRTADRAESAGLLRPDGAANVHAAIREGGR